ncbi:MAG: TonB-dependent receptor [Haliea sp.]|uniref:TonB-dependent receptor n=1 Tax=Haliea sp. TaxID=1932666 RepID=UPI0032ED641C
MQVNSRMIGAILAATTAGFQYQLAAQPASGLQLEEVIVTAQKREQSFNEVGIAVTALSGDEIKALRLNQPVDIAAQTPNLRINNVVANSIPNVTIRGIGLNDYATNNNPAAGIYIDEVYLVSPAMLSFQMHDLARVEVLKGPQGTLFGRNTTAGAVNFIANRPSEEFTAGATLDYGRYEHASGQGFVSGELMPGLAGRLSVQRIRQSEGHQTNRVTGEDVGRVASTAWRALLQWQPTESLDILLNVHGGKDDSDIHLVKIDNPFSAEDDGDRDVFRSGSSVATLQQIDSEGFSLTANWAFADALSLTSISAWEELDRFHVEDRDATSLAQLDGYFDNAVEQFSQELRLTYLGDELVWIAGAFYGNDDVKTRDRFDAGDLLPLLGLDGFASLGNEYRQDSDSIALFLHTEWQATPVWRLTAGLRYTDEEKTFADAFTYLIGDGIEAPLFPSVRNEYSNDDVSGKFGVDYTGFEDTLLYASISRGFKSGGFQGQLTFNPADLQPFQEESLLAYEAGAKLTLLDGSMQLNASIFCYDYEDMQFYGGIFDSPVGTLFGIANVGDSEVTGGEIELAWRPVQGLDLRLGMGLLDTEITSSVVGGVVEGSELPNSPELNLNGVLRYQWPLSSGLYADAMVDFNYQDDMAFDIVRQPLEAREDSYWLWNARAGIGAASGAWTLSLWGKNLSDERYRTQVLFSSVGFGESWGMPRTYGVSLDLSI